MRYLSLLLLFDDRKIPYIFLNVSDKNRQDLLDHLGQMELTTNQSLDVLSKSVLIGQNNNQLATGKNNEKEISIWKRRAKMIQLFKEGVEKLRKCIKLISCLVLCCFFFIYCFFICFLCKYFTKRLKY